VTVRVFWDEIGRAEQTIEVVQYLTDPSKLEAAMQAGQGIGGPGAPGAGGVTPPTGPSTKNPLQGGGAAFGAAVNR